MTQFAIIVLASVSFAFLAIAAVYAVQTHLLARALGPLDYPFPGRSWLQFHGILIVSPLLPIIALLRSLDPLIVITVSILGFLCFMIALRDIMFGKISGIHQNGFVWNGTVVMFDAVTGVDTRDTAALVVSVRSGDRHTIVPQDSGVMVALVTALGDVLSEEGR